MTIDEAIQRENKIAEENQKMVDTEIVFDDVSLSQLYCDDTEVIEEHLENYKKCAEYHKQLVDWLEELKELRELKSKLNINSQYRLYRIWQMMRQRCNNENAENYKYYGGRGIYVCNEWENDFSLFALWSFANGYNDNLTIDRIESNGNYEPSNCRWISKKEQTNNRSSNTKYTYDGETHTLSEWADIYKINKETFYTRWSNGKRGTELFAPAKIKTKNREPIEYNGKTQTIRQWSEEYNINYSTLIKRLDSGIDISTALTKPVDKRFRNSKYDEIAEQLKEGGKNE